MLSGRCCNSTRSRDWWWERASGRKRRSEREKEREEGADWNVVRRCYIPRRRVHSVQKKKKRRRRSQCSLRKFYQPEVAWCPIYKFSFIPAEHMHNAIMMPTRPYSYFNIQLCVFKFVRVIWNTLKLLLGNSKELLTLSEMAVITAARELLEINYIKVSLYVYSNYYWSPRIYEVCPKRTWSETFAHALPI